MEKHRCKLCFKSFVNGRALGGHMRSHMMNLYVPPKPEQQQQQHIDDDDDRLGEETESTPSPSPSPSLSEEEEDENEEKSLLCYGLRENPKKSVRLVDPEFSFAGSVVLQDRESETESSKNPTRRRSKRIRRSGISDPDHHDCHSFQNPKEPETKKPKSCQTGKPESPSPSPVSSISDISPEEDVACCLMMLSRDKWELRDEEEEDEDEQTEDDDSDSDELKNSNKTRIRGKYKCETCHRVFRSYQALGGHRASHKKNRVHNNGGSIRQSPLEVAETRVAEEKVHECPVCYRVFASGQALGGHKRSHVTGSSSAITIVPSKPVPPLKLGCESLIDLNLPAPTDDDDISQIELSAVSDAEFVNTHQGINVLSRTVCTK